ncbi:MAG TPA: chromosome partitioning protein ParA [Rhodospirillaceae bacterium]|nr:MAG: chromosome partitioning protein ParA [Alphaproteobacteria bacterium GWF2_58_20]HAU28550.1 chromosome partitioning protein ParA [Rhodospirillaceae bacterium]
MISILVGNTKGGCGKTTMATNLAVAMASAGRQVLLADADKQHSSLLWAARRPSHLAAIATCSWSRGEALKVPRGVDRLIMDAPAAMRRGQIEELVDMADIIVIPVLPSVFDEDGSRQFLKKLSDIKAVRRNRKILALVGNRVRANTRAAARLDLFLNGAGLNVLTRLRDSQLYSEVANVGLGLFDLKDKRTEVFRADWEPLLSYIEDGVL